mmetsp:Transcript_18526/g.59127  ORF Transcript_18526/g.59127 Transcript_18526/m.59127 type:complete len:200 (-) Transcript_18526:676-1275(-)
MSSCSSSVSARSSRRSSAARSSSAARRRGSSAPAACSSARRSRPSALNSCVPAACGPAARSSGSPALFRSAACFGGSGGRPSQPSLASARTATWASGSLERRAPAVSRTAPSRQPSSTMPTCCAWRRKKMGSTWWHPAFVGAKTTSCPSPSLPSSKSTAASGRRGFRARPEQPSPRQLGVAAVQKVLRSAPNAGRASRR